MQLKERKDKKAAEMAAERQNAMLLAEELELQKTLEVLSAALLISCWGVPSQSRHLLPRLPGPFMRLHIVVRVYNTNIFLMER